MKPNFARFASLALAFAVVCVWATPAFPQGTAGKPAVKMTTAKRTPPDSGSIMFQEYCSACHGVRGEGNGPAATALKKPPANLSLLAKSNGGSFPQKKVEDVLRYGVQLPAHGTTDMPIWGPTFRALNSDNDVVTLRIANLVDYLKSLQAK